MSISFCLISVVFHKLNRVIKHGADIVFCGHVHGGSIRLPFVGGLLSPERKFFPKYSKGVYSLGDTDMVVSAGIGKPRVFNPPEIVFCEIAL